MSQSPITFAAPGNAGMTLEDICRTNDLGMVFAAKGILSLISRGLVSAGGATPEEAVTYLEAVAAGR